MLAKELICSSITSFSKSPNCDLSSVDNFINSYIYRKKEVIRGKLHAQNQGNRINEKKLWWYRASLKVMTDNREKDWIRETIREAILEQKKQKSATRVPTGKTTRDIANRKIYYQKELFN